MPQPPTHLLVIAGPTASGKSRLALGVAEALGGEIISADAFAVYRGMDIGTATPSESDRARIPHHLIDILDPHESFSAGDFAAAADRAIAEINARASVAIVVGGTNFYIEALLSGLFPSPPHNPDVRGRLSKEWEKDPVHLFKRLTTVDAESAERIGPNDRQRILRALEVYEISGTPLSELWRKHPRSRRYRAVIAAPQRPREELYARIDARVDTMFSDGLIDEVARILDFGVPREAHALKAIGYRESARFLEGEWTLEEAAHHTKMATRRFAKRQLTWLRHHDQEVVHWVSPDETPGVGEILSLWAERRGGQRKEGER